jgi:hypothetical protein
MDFVRLDNPPAKACNALKETYEAYSDDLSDLQVPGIPGLSNAVKKMLRPHLIDHELNPPTRFKPSRRSLKRR